MPINLSLYILVSLILWPILSLEIAFIEQFVTILCGIGIATVGVAHGAIDDVLHGSRKGKQRLFFILKYVTAIVLFGIIWLISPNLAFLVFLTTSGFHFGQTQLTGFKIQSKLVSTCLYFLWGSFVIFSMLAFNKESLMQTNENIVFIPKLYYHVLENAEIYLIGITSILSVFMIGIALKMHVSFKMVLREFFLLFLIICSFQVFEAFVAFSIFFILVHSTQAIQQEFVFCKKENIVKNSLQFFSLFVPLTISLLVIVGIFLFGLIYFEYDNFIPTAMIILLSCVTIPHCFVMDKFYSNRD